MTKEYFDSLVELQKSLAKPFSGIREKVTAKDFESGPQFLKDLDLLLINSMTTLSAALSLYIGINYRNVPEYADAAGSKEAATADAAPAEG